MHVALLVSAWIEIATTVNAGTHALVALLVSAWIEIKRRLSGSCQPPSRTPRECVD